MHVGQDTTLLAVGELSNEHAAVGYAFPGSNFQASASAAAASEGPQYMVQGSTVEQASKKESASMLHAPAGSASLSTVEDPDDSFDDVIAHLSSTNC